jgi:hypothetical protein
VGQSQVRAELLEAHPVGLDERAHHALLGPSQVPARDGRLERAADPLADGTEIPSIASAIPVSSSCLAMDQNT